MSTISARKKARLGAVSDSRGTIAAIALDQRSALRSLFAIAMGIDAADVPAEKIIEFKHAATRILTPHASAILLDPEYGLSAARHRAKNAGLLLAYEQTGYDKAVPGRLPRLLDGWSAQRLAETGADCVKILLYYSSFSSTEINNEKRAFVIRVGEECAAADLPFFLELVSYADGMEDKSPEFARIKPEIVARGVTEFSKPEYRVDILKVGLPVNLAFVEGSPAGAGDFLYSRSHAVQHIRNAAESAAVPFIYLSEGVSNQAFQFGLELAAEAGAKFSGVLCGRATWKDGVPVLVEKGSAALEDWLSEQGVRNLRNVNARLNPATPWSIFHGTPAVGLSSK